MHGKPVRRKTLKRQAADIIFRKRSDNHETKPQTALYDEAVRAAQIIDRVRSWSQGRVNRQVLEADQGVKRAVQSFMLTNRSRGISIRTGVLQSAKVWMDLLELELIVVNLLSNAAEAARKSDPPTVMIDLQTARESLPGDVAAVVLTITDNGPALSDQTFAVIDSTACATSSSVSGSSSMRRSVPLERF
mgnify:CR=1 FL=1